MTPIRALLEALGRDSTPDDLSRHAYPGLSAAERHGLSAEGHIAYQGKVRDVVTFGDELLIVHSDRLSAFDKLIAMVPYKGSILTAISAHWLKDAEAVVPTHYLDTVHERVLRTRRMDPVKIEVVVRGYMAGNLMRAYGAGEREYCGAMLPEGLIPYGKIPTPIITPTTKAAAFEHDENATPRQLIERGVVSEMEWRQIQDMSLALFAHGTKKFAEHGWVLFDTKYEFGRDGRGHLRVIDEIHTPDSSRFCEVASYNDKLSRHEVPIMLDKEGVRRYLMGVGFKGEGAVPSVPIDLLLDLAKIYLHVAETITGEPILSNGPEQHIDLHLLR